MRLGSVQIVDCFKGTKINYKEAQELILFRIFFLSLNIVTKNGTCYSFNTGLQILLESG